MVQVPSNIISTLLLLLFLHLPSTIHADFITDFSITWAPDHVKILDNAQELQLTLDQNSGSGFASKNTYLFGKIDMQIKVVPGNSAGIVTAYYLSSESSNHNELDFEFLGNVPGQRYILQTNVFSNGVGGREQRFHLWFDPTADFHTYSVLWSPQHIIFSVDGMEITVFPNDEASGVPYLNKQPMRVYSSIWNGESWATNGGSVKIDWKGSPFVASYRGFKADACEWTGNTSGCTAAKWWNAGVNQLTDTRVRNRLNWVRTNYMIYDYCSDKPRYPKSPPECSVYDQTP